MAKSNKGKANNNKEPNTVKVAKVEEVKEEVKKEEPKVEPKVIETKNSYTYFGKGKFSYNDRTYRTGDTIEVEVAVFLRDLAPFGLFR